MQQRVDCRLNSVPKVSRKLGVSPATIMSAIERGELESITLNGRIWVPERALTKLFEHVA